MTLAQLPTPFERHRIIHYAADGNKIIRHWYEMQHVTASLYKGREIKNEYGETEYDTFLLFDGAAAGLRFEYRMKHPEWYTVEAYGERLKKIGCDTLERFLLELDRCVTENHHIGNAEITFVRQFDSERAERYAQHRERRLKEQEQRHLKEMARRKAEEQEREERRKAEDLAERAKLLGWADNMTSLKFGRVKLILDALIRVDGKVMTKRDFIIRAVRDGWVPKCEDGITSCHGNRWNQREGKPRAEYRISRERYGYKITKTEYDFALYLTDHAKTA